MSDEAEVVCRGIIAIIVSAFLIAILLNIVNVICDSSITKLNHEIEQVKSKVDSNVMTNSYNETEQVRNTSRIDDHKLINLNLDINFDFSLLSIGLISSAVPLLLYKDKLRFLISSKVRKSKQYEIVIDDNKERGD